MASHAPKRCAGQPVPRDVKRAVALMRESLCQPLSMRSLAARCGVAERTLNQHFRNFVGLSPIQYLRRLRLAAARDALLGGRDGGSVTNVAETFGFNHFGRFAEQYRQLYGETPSATLRAREIVDVPAARETPASQATDRNSRHAVLSREKPSLAILIGQGATREPNVRPFAEDLTDALAAALCSVRSLAVIVPRSARAATLDPHGAGRGPGVHYVLTGRLLHAGARLRVVLCLADAATGQQMWGDSFEGPRDRVFDLHDRIIGSVLRATLPNIRGAEIERASRAAPRSLDAYGLSMRALPLLFASRPDASGQALELLHRAIDIDPAYPLATALAAWGHAQLVMYNGTSAPGDERRQAEQLLQRAGIVDDDDPLGLTARCAVHTMTGEFDAAEALVTRALAIDPTCGWAWSRSAWLHAYSGNSDVAIAQFRRALLTGPKTSRANDFVGIGTAHFHRGRYAAAASWLRKALAEQPGTAWPNRSLSVAYARIGEPLKARRSLDALRRSNPDLTVSQVLRAVPFRPEFLERLGNGLSDLGLPP